MTVRKFASHVVVFAAGFAIALATCRTPQRAPAPPPTITTIYARCPGDEPWVVHTFAAESPSKPGDVAAWWVGPDGRVNRLGHVKKAD